MCGASSCCVEALLAARSCSPPRRRAQWLPKQPIKILVGYRAGRHRRYRRAASPADTDPAPAPATPCIVDSKTGAGGFIALKAVAESRHRTATRSASASWASSRSAPVVPGSQIPLDLDKELVPICNLVGVPMALIVRTDAPFKTIPELVAYAKANPGKVTYASTGLGSTNQLGAEFLAAEAGGLKLIHVPYRGGARRPSPTWRPAMSTSSSPTCRRS